MHTKHLTFLTTINPIPFDSDVRKIFKLFQKKEYAAGHILTGYGYFQDRADHRHSLSSSGVLILVHNVYSQIHQLALRIYVTAIAILSLISSMGAIDELACRIYCAASPMFVQTYLGHSV